MDTTGRIKEEFIRAVQGHIANGRADRIKQARDDTLVKLVQAHGSESILNHAEHVRELLRVWEREAQG